MSIRFRCLSCLVGVASCLLATEITEAQITPGAVHEWIADLDADGDSVWEDLGSQADHDWSLSGPRRVNVSSGYKIQTAYEFDGMDDEASADGENRNGDHTSSFELWFRPLSQPAGGSPIFEHGNQPRGISFGLVADQLQFVLTDGSDSVRLSHDLDVGDNGFDTDDFWQAVAVVDDSNDLLKLYVNGQLRGTQALVGSNDFTSNDEWGLGRNINRGGGGQDAATIAWDLPFHGQIGILREYRFALSDAEVANHHRVMLVPEPTTSVLSGLGCVALAAMNRRRLSD